MNYIIILIKFIICTYFFSIGNAYAYLDPGTGSMILQVIMASIAAIGAAGTFYWRKIKMKIKSIFTKKNKKENSD
jgi:hypothetical protein